MRIMIAVCAPAAVLLLGTTIATAGTTPAPRARTGTAVATVRTLSATLTAHATVQSASDSVVIHGRGAEVPADTPATRSTPVTRSNPAAARAGKTLTALAGLGSTVTTGSMLYAVDGEPVVAVVGSTPSWRTLEVGVEDGPDVRTLERALVKCGFGKGLTVDKRFTWATAEAVRDWEKALHRRRPDGVVQPSEIVLLGGDRQIADQVLDVGAVVASEAQVLTLVSTERVISASVPAADLAAWKAGATVTVRRPQGGSIRGRVTVVSHDLTDEDAGVTVMPAIDRRAAIHWRTGATADVELVTRTHPNALTVPVAAVHDGPGGGPAVTLVADDATTIRPVTLGLLTQGRAEVTSGLRPGDVVQLPGGRVVQGAR